MAARQTFKIGGLYEPTGYAPVIYRPKLVLQTNGFYELTPGTILAGTRNCPQLFMALEEPKFHMVERTLWDVQLSDQDNPRIYKVILCSMACLLNKNKYYACITFEHDAYKSNERILWKTIKRII